MAYYNTDRPHGIMIEAQLWLLLLPCSVYSMRACDRGARAQNLDRPYGIIIVYYNTDRPHAIIIAYYNTDRPHGIIIAYYNTD